MHGRKNNNLWVALTGLSFFLMFFSACKKPPLTVETVKMIAEKIEKNWNDTTQLDVRVYNSSLDSQWFVVYSKVPDTMNMLFYLNNDVHFHHKIKFSSKPEGIISKLSFQDITEDGYAEMILELSYDYGLRYQRKETIIIRNPFDADYQEKIFETIHYERWGTIGDFDGSSNPHYVYQTDYDVKVELMPGKIVESGIIVGIPKRIHEFVWDSDSGKFVPSSEKESLQLMPRRPTDGSLRSAKVAIRVQPEREECNSYQLIDRQSKAVPLPAVADTALQCAGIFSLSPSGRYLIFEDIDKTKLLMWDFYDQKMVTLHQYVNATEGISDILWSPSGQKFAYIVVNQEEFQDNSKLYVVKPSSGGQFQKKAQNVKVQYDCSTGVCRARAKKDFWFKSENMIGLETYRLETDERKGTIECATGL